jgi:hypothetical protein
MVYDGFGRSGYGFRWNDRFCRNGRVRAGDRSLGLCLGGGRSLGIRGALLLQLVQLLLKQTQLLFQERNFHIVATGLGYGW